MRLRERTNVYKVKMTQRQSQNRCTMHTICLFAFGSGMQCMTTRQIYKSVIHRIVVIT